MRGVDIKPKYGPSGSESDDAPNSHINEPRPSLETRVLTSHMSGCVAGSPNRYISPHWGRTALCNLEQAGRNYNTVGRVMWTKHTSGRSSWDASAKNSSETETTRPPIASLESSDTRRVRLFDGTHEDAHQ